MKKLGLPVALSIVTVMCTSAAFSQASAPSGESKMKKLENGVMWGPRKIGAGLKKMGSGAKNMMSHKKNSSSSK